MPAVFARHFCCTASIVSRACFCAIRPCPAPAVLSFVRSLRVQPAASYLPLAVFAALPALKPRPPARGSPARPPARFCALCPSFHSPPLTLQSPCQTLVRERVFFNLLPPVLLTTDRTLQFCSSGAGFSNVFCLRPYIKARLQSFELTRCLAASRKQHAAGGQTVRWTGADRLRSPCRGLLPI